MQTLSDFLVSGSIVLFLLAILFQILVIHRKSQKKREKERCANNAKLLAYFEAKHQLDDATLKQVLGATQADFTAIDSEIATYDNLRNILSTLGTALVAAWAFVAFLLN